MANKRATIEGVVLLGSGLIGIADGVRLVVFKNPNSVEDFTGPGRYLFVISMLLAIIGAFFLFFESRAPVPAAAPAAPEEEENASTGKLIAIVGVLALYTLLIDILGYFVATQIFFLLILRVLGMEFSLRMIAVAVAMGLGFYLLFVRIFGMSFPHGMFF